MPQIRESIMDALVSRLEGITVASGYRTSVEKVERSVRDPGNVGPSERPLIGIGFLREDYRDTSGGQVEVVARYALLCHVRPALASDDSVVESLSDITADIRKALYTSPTTLGVSGVHFAKVVSRQGMEGVVEAAKKRDASTVVEIAIKFTESVTA